jgi:bacillithiol biosynthesis cysteine-adding enzyme BshC
LPSLRCRSFPEATYAGAFAALQGDFGRVAPFFAYNPADPAAWAARAEAVDAAWAGPDAVARRRKLAGALTRYLQRIGGSPAQLAAAESLAEPRALAAVTGQQAGLLTGPLLTLYKAITVLRVAAEQQARLGRPVIPVFWVASEDHDFAEVNQVRAVDAAARPVRLRLPPMPNRRSVGDIPVPGAARHLVSAAVSLVPPETADPATVQWLRDSLEAALRGRESLATWFARLLAALFRDQGLVLLDPMLPELRELAVPVIAQSLARAPAVNAALAEAAGRLRAAELTPGLALEPDHLHVFYHDDRERVALFHQGGSGVRARHGEVAFSAEAFARAVADRPGAFSPGVVLRPVVQDVILPTLCQVSGPGEAAYLAQMRQVFPLFGRGMPVIRPRLGATLALPEDAAAAAAVDLDLGGLRDGSWRRAVESVVQSRSRLDVAERFAAERAVLRERYAALARDLSHGVAPALHEIAERNGAHVLWQLDYLEKKAIQHERRRERSLLRAVEGAAHRLFPEGHLQESTQSVVPYLLRYGLGLVRELTERVPLDQGHVLVQLAD